MTDTVDHRLAAWTPEYPHSPAPSDDESLCNDGAKSSRALIGAALQQHINAIDPDDCEPGAEDAFFVADLGEVYRQHRRWQAALPRVTPHYAVKCNPDPQVLRLLARLGAGFDCASKAEIEQVLAMGVAPARVIYAQPCKTKSYLRYTAQQGVRQMTFDNADELHKIASLVPEAELFLRIATDDSASLCRLSQKFGADMTAVPALLQTARSLNLNVVGVAFHVGSGASDPAAFQKAVADARAVFDLGATLGFAMHTLDCGGGFVSDTFDAMAAVLSAALDAHFPPSVRVIAEPGRYYTASAFTLACHVIARREVAAVPATEAALTTGLPSYMLYLNDGVYGNFSSIIFDHQHPVPQVLRSARHADAFAYGPAALKAGNMCDSGYASADELSPPLTPAASPAAHAQAYEYSLWGPTCDGIDVVSAQWFCPEKLDIGDWLYFEEMGAYTKCSATRFNGFPDKHTVRYVCSEDAAGAILL